MAGEVNQAAGKTCHQDLEWLSASRAMRAQMAATIAASLASTNLVQNVIKGELAAQRGIDNQPARNRGVAQACVVKIAVSMTHDILRALHDHDRSLRGGVSSETPRRLNLEQGDTNESEMATKGGW